PACYMLPLHDSLPILEFYSATPLPDEILEAIRRKLTESRLTHSKIEFRTKTDPALIGGFVIAFDDKLYDASVRHQLQQLRASFRSEEHTSELQSRENL